MSDEERIKEALEIKRSVEEAAGLLLNRFLTKLRDYEEVDNRIEIAVVKDMFCECVEFTLGCYEPAKEAPDGYQEG